VDRVIASSVGAFALGAAAFALGGRRADEPAPRVPARVVSLAPSMTETVFALGEGRRVVGVSAGVAWPPEALGVLQVGGYLDADVEAITGLAPDLVLVQGLHAYVTEQARELGIAVRRIEMNTLAEIERATAEIGAALGVPDAAEALTSRVRGELEEVRARARGRRPLRTFLHVAYGVSLPEPPFLTAGRGTFLTEVLGVAGGANVFADLARPFPEVTVEAIVERAPEVVVVSLPGAKISPEDAEAIRAAWRRILPARDGVAAGERGEVRVVFLTADCAQVPGPRVGLLAREMERSLWGE